MKRKSPLRKVSKLKHRLAKRFIPKATQEAIVERSGGYCERIYWVEGVGMRCMRPGETFHHVLKRSQGGNDHSLEDTRHSCNRCNDDAELHPMSCIEDEWVKPWRGYKHPRDFEAYKISKGIKS